MTQKKYFYLSSRLNSSDVSNEFVPYILFYNEIDIYNDVLNNISANQYRNAFNSINTNLNSISYTTFYENPEVAGNFLNQEVRECLVKCF